MRVATIQCASQPADAAANLATMRTLVAQAAAARADFAIFPECNLSGYWFLRNLDERALRALAEPLPDGPSARAVARMARETGMSIGAGLIEAAPDGRLFNSYFVAMPDGGFARHRKLHAFEHDAISSGDSYTVFEDPHGITAGILICYDNNIIENPRATALAGARLLIAPHQTGGCRTANPHLLGLIERRLWDDRARDPAALRAEFLGDKGRGWLMRWLPSRAHDNGIFVAFSNGVGIDDDEIRPGHAMVVDPYGRILAECDALGGGMAVADLDLALLEHATGAEWMLARRPELYAPLTVPTGRERSAREMKFRQ
ncbi:MAG: acyltransferase [Planctomycetes bacterium]|nr:acyltransferase [Planctomycetota bacterium]